MAKKDVLKGIEESEAIRAEYQKKAKALLVDFKAKKIKADDYMAQLEKLEIEEKQAMDQLKSSTATTTRHSNEGEAITEEKAVEAILKAVNSKNGFIQIKDNKASFFPMVDSRGRKVSLPVYQKTAELKALEVAFGIVHKAGGNKTAVVPSDFKLASEAIETALKSKVKEAVDLANNYKALDKYIELETAFKATADKDKDKDEDKDKGADLKVA